MKLFKWWRRTVNRLLEGEQGARSDEIACADDEHLRRQMDDYDDGFRAGL